jgi:hypothetical protein
MDEQQKKRAEDRTAPRIKNSRPPLPRWYYLLVIWHWVLGLLVLYFIIRYAILSSLFK